ncbi:MAG: SUMF1/EgtB/PvdO family nonheme iron enzyme [Pontiella sp.]
MKIKQNTILWVATMIVAGSYADTFVADLGLTFQNISSDSNPSSGIGQVGYDYGIGTYEITRSQWGAFVADGGPVGSGAGYAEESNTSGDRPVGYTSWNEAAQFVNWLNINSGYAPAYKFDESGVVGLWDEDDQSEASAYRHKDTVYVLPSNDEWVKAAYWNGTELQESSMPDNDLDHTDAKYEPDYGSTWEVGSGTQEINGTYDMAGNVWEWTDTAGSEGDDMIIRGGAYFNPGTMLLSTDEGLESSRTLESSGVGFRVVVIPEPASIMLLGLFGGGVWFFRRIFIR